MARWSSHQLVVVFSFCRVPLVVMKEAQGERERRTQEIALHSVVAEVDVSTSLSVSCSLLCRPNWIEGDTMKWCCWLESGDETSKSPFTVSVASILLSLDTSFTHLSLLYTLGECIFERSIVPRVMNGSLAITRGKRLTTKWILLAVGSAWVAPASTLSCVCVILVVYMLQPTHPTLSLSLPLWEYKLHFAFLFPSHICSVYKMNPCIKLLSICNQLWLSEAELFSLSLTLHCARAHEEGVHV